MFHSYSFRAFLLLIGLCVGGWKQPVGGQEVTPPAELMPAEVILQKLRDRDPEAALAELGKAVEPSITIRDLVYTSLPAAAGGLSRSLAQMSSDEQYELLETWTLPADGRDAVRLFTIPVPTDAPPKSFARSIGERPRDSTFAVAQVGPVRGLFCSGWLFVNAANDLGRLGRLRSTLEELAKQDVAGAEELLMLAHLAGDRGQLELVKTYWQELLRDPETAGDADPTPAELSPLDITRVAIAAAATRHEPLQPMAELFLQELVDRSGTDQSIDLRPFLRLAHAIAVQAHRGQSSADVMLQNRLKHWVPVTIRSSRDLVRGKPAAVWLTHEQHVLHLAGGTTDVMMCRFPIVGDFDFVCETQEGGAIGTDGGLVYGGLHFQALGRKDTLSVWDSDGNHLVTKPSPFARHDNRPVFNRVSIRSRSGAAQFESNFHPVWFDKAPLQTSPWLGLRSSGTKRPVFRNLQLTGTPIIPREVRLTQGDHLRGWQSGFFGETQPAFSAEAGDEQAAAQSFDWQMRTGQLIGGKHDGQSAASPGLLQYQRPLLENESIAYEFFQEDKEATVHPAIGRLAFLLEPTGVRVRWITTASSEWTGLPADNAVLEPLNRRGPRPLPLKESSWNKLLIKRSEDKVQITLNDQLVYQRPLDTGAETQFGLYRPARDAEVRVRGVVMTGDWPAEVPADFRKDPVQLTEASSQPSDVSLTGHSLQDLVAGNILATRRPWATLPRDE